MRIGRKLALPLGTKLMLILAGLGVVGAVAMALLLGAVITPSFDRLEREAVAAHVDRTRMVLKELVSSVESGARDYGDWNASYDYMGHPTEAFERESFSTLAMVNLDINGMAYVRDDGQAVIARWLDLDRSIDMPDMRAALVSAVRTLDADAAFGSRSSTGFYQHIGDAVVAIGMARVRRSDGTGSPRGYVLMARTVTSSELSALLQLDARLEPKAGGTAVSVGYSPRQIGIAVPIQGARGEPVARLVYSVPRALSLLGSKTLQFAVLGSTALLLVLIVALRMIFGRMVLSRIGRVERHMGVVRSSGALDPLTEPDKGDEIDSLVGSFNAMLRQLKDLQEQVEVQSFELGQSESAVAVMHNVRNALNPISTVLGHGLARGGAVDRATLDRALAELARDDIPAARREKLVAFLTAAANAEAEAHAARREGIEVGRAALGHVLEIIGKQQAQAHKRPELELCDITEIIAKNAAIARYSGAVSIGFQFPAKPHPVLGSRVILSQVIGNLLANAAESIAATGRDGGTISVTVEENDANVKIVIADDGEGFDPALSNTLFQRGYSTRAHKSGGLGLHWCANSMLSMKGTLDLRSDGKGTGAHAILTLQRPPVAHAVVEEEAARAA